MLAQGLFLQRRHLETTVVVVVFSKIHQEALNQEIIWSVVNMVILSFWNILFHTYEPSWNYIWCRSFCCDWCVSIGNQFMRCRWCFHQEWVILVGLDVHKVRPAVFLLLHYTHNIWMQHFFMLHFYLIFSQIKFYFYLHRSVAKTTKESLH